jgi:hypothetical protein
MMATKTKPVPTLDWNRAILTEPEEEGVYFVRRRRTGVGYRYSYWNGKEWKWASATPKGALTKKEPSPGMCRKDAEWCGAK